MTPRSRRKATKALLEEPSSPAADVDSVTSDRPSRKVTEFFMTKRTPQNETTPSLVYESDKASLDASDDDVDADDDTRTRALKVQLASSSEQLTPLLPRSRGQRRPRSLRSRMPSPRPQRVGVTSRTSSISRCPRRT